MEPDVTRAGKRLELDLAVVEAAFTDVWTRWERSLEELGGSVPASQLRAVLAINASGAVPVPRLAATLGMSSSGAGRLCDGWRRLGWGHGSWMVAAARRSCWQSRPLASGSRPGSGLSAVPTSHAAWNR